MLFTCPKLISILFCMGGERQFSAKHLSALAYNNQIIRIFWLRNMPKGISFMNNLHVMFAIWNMIVHEQIFMEIGLFQVNWKLLWICMVWCNVYLLCCFLCVLSAYIRSFSVRTHFSQWCEQYVADACIRLALLSIEAISYAMAILRTFSSPLVLQHHTPYIHNFIADNKTKKYIADKWKSSVFSFLIFVSYVFLYYNGRLSSPQNSYE